MQPGRLRAQAARVLHYELLRAHAAHPAALLPRLQSALLAWPEALPAPAGGEDALGRVVLAAAHDIVRDVLRAPPRPADDTATVLGSLAASTAAATCGADVNATARELWGTGRRLWCWGALEGGGGAQAAAADAPQWSALQRELQGVLSGLAAAPGTERPAGARTSAVRALDMVLACLGPHACRRPVRFGPPGACECAKSCRNPHWLQSLFTRAICPRCVARHVRRAMDARAGVPSRTDCGGGVRVRPDQHLSIQ